VPTRASCREGDPSAPRTLVLALDGVPLRVVVRARELGRFAGWPPPVPMVSTFPSVTNVSFTAMFRPFGVPRAGGYELQYYDRERNEVVSASVVNYEERIYAWRDLFDVTPRTLGSKFAGYTRPLKKASKELEEARHAVLELPQDLVLVHVGGTDSLMHLRGDKKVLRFVLELEPFVDALKREHLETRGRPLRVVLLSDHGNTQGKIYAAPGIRRSLRRAGLRVVDELAQPDDVVAATFGLVGYGALYLADRERAGEAGSAVASTRAVDVAAWISGPQEVTVAGPAGEAHIHWREASDGREYAYAPRTADPLQLIDARDRLEREGRLDPAGFAGQADWFRVSSRGEFPDPLDRLVRALDGSYVKRPASVVFSLRPGYAWGWRSAHASSWLQGGRLEGTHGGLDRESTLGFFMPDDPRLIPGPAGLRSERALAGLREFSDCLSAAGASARRSDGENATN